LVLNKKQNLQKAKGVGQVDKRDVSVATKTSARYKPMNSKIMPMNNKIDVLGENNKEKRTIVNGDIDTISMSNVLKNKEQA
jgi:hypothetical protein